MRKYIYHITLLIYLYISLFPQTAMAATKRSGNSEIVAEIPARINLKIFGYTAPDSTVQVESVRVFGKTVSRADGYFEFTSMPISDEADEVCLVTVDAEKRVGFPVCIPIPKTEKIDEIGPIILSPTLSISNNMIWQGDQAVASGRTVPQTEVVVSFFESQSDKFSRLVDKTMALFLPAIAEAKQVPLLSVSSDRRGNFSLNLPTSKAAYFRMFSKAIYRETPSPKSTTLSFQIGSFWAFFLRFTLYKILILLLILVCVAYLVSYELRHKTLRSRLSYLNETRFGPLAVKLRLRLKRLWYNYQDFRKSNRK